MKKVKLTKKKEKDEMIRTSFSYRTKTKKKLMEFAQKDQRSLASYVHNVIEDHCERLEAKEKKNAK